MKKFVTMALVVIFALCAAAPALAYTTNTPPPSGSSLYTLDVYLVEYAGDDFLGGWISQKPVNRGYAKNEVVAAVAALTIPSNSDVYGDGYRSIEVTGKNVALHVTENNISGSTARLITTFPYDSATGSGIAPHTFTWDSGDNTIRHAIGAPNGTAGNEIAVPSSTKTYRLLFFGKVLSDDASVSFRLSKNAQFESTAATWASQGAFLGVAGLASSTGTHYLALNEDYVVVRQASNNYIIFENNNFTGSSMPGNPLFRIEVGSRGKTERLFMYTGAYDGPLYRVLAEPSGRELMFFAVANVPGKASGEPVRYGESGYAALRFFYDAHFENGLGFSAFNEGNILADKDFRAIANAEDVLETAKVEPWVPYVKAPDNIVTNPPKTGYKPSMLGFTFVVIALAGAVVVRKVRAKA